MVGEADVPGEEDGQPVAAQLDLDALGQLLQRRKVVGREVVGQGDVELLLVGLHMDLWRTEQDDRSQLSI